MNWYLCPPKTKTSPFFILSRNASSITPTFSPFVPPAATTTLTKLSSGIVRKNRHDLKLLRVLSKASRVSEASLKEVAVGLCEELTGTWVIPTKSHAKEWVQGNF